MADIAPFPSLLQVPAAHWDCMVAHVRACAPEEACGLLGGLLPQGLVRACLPVENALHRPDRFRMVPAEQLKAFLWFEKEGLELLAIFHSHPAGPAIPSPTDRAEFAYPGVLSLIFSPAPSSPGWQARAFAIEDIYATNATAREVPLRLLPGT